MARTAWHSMAHRGSRAVPAPRAQHRPTTARGYALPFVILMLIILAVATATLLFVLTAGARSTESMVSRRKLFYACDGLGRVTALAAQDYLGTVATPTPEGMLDFVCTTGGGCPTGDPDNPPAQLPTYTSQTPGFRVRSFAVDAVRRIGNEKLTNGPFAGMNALQDSVTMTLNAAKEVNGWQCEQKQELVLGKIAMFQFFIFSDVEYTEWTPGPAMTATGRMHANGSAGLCVAANNTLHLERVTVATPGRLRHHSEGTGCRPDTTGGSGKVFIATTDTAAFSPAPTATTPGFTEFVSRANPGLTAFNGHAVDDVPRLRLPVIGTPVMQNGSEADADVVGNAGTSRFLVDPPWADERANPAMESVRRQKFACKADLRIINSVWYLRDATDDDCTNWPGTPIWSDHPLAFTTPTSSTSEEVEVAGLAVGQNDLAAAHTWPTRPTRFSSYVFSSTGALQTPSTSARSVISYGVLARDGATSTWKAGFRTGAAPIVCPATPGSCAVSPAVSAADFVRGTRAGIRLGTAQQYFGVDLATDPLVKAANLLPINFDVAAFQHALATTTAGELGSYFPGDLADPDDTRRKFNGIVWITSTWFNSSKGRSSATERAAIVPPQGARADAGQLGAIVSPALAAQSAEQQALPYPLCADTGGATLATGFTVPACASYKFNSTAPSATDMKNARPTALRIYNARNVNVEAAVDAPDIAVGRLPRGLSIVSNLPTFLLGDVNTSSIPEPATDPQWVPFLVGGDMVYLLSNNWDDARSSWGMSMSVASGVRRLPVETTFNTSILAGWNTTPTTDSSFGYWSGGLHNFPKFQEDWSSVKARIRGSMVVGWNSVYVQWPFHCCSTISYSAPIRDWGFDRHLDTLLNQPPGAPLFDVNATRSWSR